MSAQFGLMFKVLEGGVIETIRFSKDPFLSDISIITLDESSESIFLWHGAKQGLVARRTALRQAESLKGHGYTVGKSIIGRDLKSIKEIDARKIGRVPEDTTLNEELQTVLDKSFTELNDFVVSFQKGGIKPVFSPKGKSKVKPKPAATTTKAAARSTAPSVSRTAVSPKSASVGSEYDDSEPLTTIKSKSAPAPSIKVSTSSLLTEAKVSFVFCAILEHFADVWISKKSDGNYSVEMMDGPICQFTIKEGLKLNFTANSFSGIDPSIKAAIQKKFIELSKLI